MFKSEVSKAMAQEMPEYARPQLIYLDPNTNVTPGYSNLKRFKRLEKHV